MNQRSGSCTLKVIEVPFSFYPDPVGGTEVYVASLARQLMTGGNKVVVAAPGESNQTYVHGGITVRRFAVCQQLRDIRELYGDGDATAASGFANVLDEEKPDVVHLHAFTRGVSLRLVREVKARNLPVVFTYHTPTVSCQRGTMMRRGTEPCGGVMDLHDCSRCALHGLASGSGKRGALRSLAYALGSVPPGVGEFLGKRGLSGGPWTALRMTELVRLRHATTRAFLAEVDHIVAVCEWVRQVLLRNGVPAGKITLCRQGIELNGECGVRSAECERRDAETPAPNGNNKAVPLPLRVAFFGRLDPTKGVHVLIQALRTIPDAPIRLDVYGIAQDEGGQRYQQELMRLASGDQRIRFLSPVSPNQVVPTLRDYDLLAVPSQWLETGPLVVLEAFAAGVPVIGSGVGGIAELVRNGTDGMVINPAEPAVWGQALLQLAEDPLLLRSFRAHVGRPRTVASVADGMLRLYQAILQGME